MKFKKLLATVLVAICAFMFVGCGQMTAKESVEIAVASATEIQLSATKIADSVALKDSEASGLSVTFDNDFGDVIGDLFPDLAGMGDITTFLTDITTKGMQMATLAETMLTKLSAFGGESLRISDYSALFLEKYAELEQKLESADVAELSKQANVLKDAKTYFETKASEFEAKALEMQEKMADLEKLQSDNLEEVLEAFANLNTEVLMEMFDWMVEQTTSSVEKMVEVITAITTINNILAKYVTQIV